MKTKMIALALFAIGIAAAFKAAGYAPLPDAPTFDPTWTPAAVELPVDTDPTIELKPVVIAVSRRAVHQAAPCAFGYRDLVQGSGQVRGFCGGGR
jgi:hypothetical protein